MSDETAVRAGRRALAELEQTDAAFEQLRRATIEALIATTPDQTGKRDRLIVTCQILDAVKDALEQTVASGGMAEHALAQVDLLRR